MYLVICFCTIPGASCNKLVPYNFQYRCLLKIIFVLKGASIRVVPSMWIRVELVSHSLPAILWNYSGIVLLGTLICCFLGQVGLNVLSLHVTLLQWVLP